MTSHEEKREAISDAIRVIPDFPKKGILFQDVTTILLDPLAFQYCIDLLVDHYKSQKIDVIAGEYGSFFLLFGLTNNASLVLRLAGFEARGLIFGAPLALALQVPFVPLRKPGKLPGR